jgi:hypothetical protein
MNDEKGLGKGMQTSSRDDFLYRSKHKIAFILNEFVGASPKDSFLKEHDDLKTTDPNENQKRNRNRKRVRKIKFCAAERCPNREANRGFCFRHGVSSTKSQ